MKKIFVSSAALIALPLAALAQSNVTVSGSVSIGLRHVSNVDSAGGSSLNIDGTPEGNGILSFKGMEDLGGGSKALFILDIPINADTGAGLPGTGNFFKNSIVGLSGSWGKLTAGRQVAMAGAVGPAILSDPTYGGSTYTETTWMGAYGGMRFNNSLQYEGLFNNIFVGGLYAPGEQTASGSRGDTKALSLGYQKQGLLVRAATQESTDGTNKKASITTVGGYMAVTPQLVLGASHLRGSYDKGFVAPAATGTPGSALYFTSMGFGAPLAGDSEVSAYILGVTYRPSENWTLKAAHHSASMTGATFLSAFSGLGEGKQEMSYLLAEYALSKRTMLIASADYNKWTGKYSGYWGAKLPALNGSDTRSTLGLGVMHKF